MENLGIDQKILVPTQARLLAEVVGSYTYFADGDVLLAQITPCFENGKLGIAANLKNGIGFGSSEYIVFRTGQLVDKEWLYYFLSRESFRKEGAERMSGAVGHKRVAKDLYPIPVPQRIEQQRVVGILDEAFDGIATAKANAEKNLQNARALFESHLQSVFTRHGKEWVEKRLEDVCEYLNGKAHEQCIDEDGQFIVINSKFISTEGETFKRSDKALLLLHPSDIAMVLSDVPKGKALAKCFLIEEANKYTLNQRICLIRSKKFYPKFLFYQLNRNRYFLAFDNAENQTNMRLNQILSCPLFLPPMPEQQAIAAKIDSFREETQHLETIHQQKLADLDALKKSLLHQAFTGQL
jgi:type I restriction enzyme S subunit